MDPFTMAMFAGSTALGIFGNEMEGRANKAQADADEQQAKINAYIAKTRAAQADTDARAGLTDELANMRAVLGANGQQANVGTLALFDELREVRGRERRVSVANRMQEARDFETAAGNAERRGSYAMPMARMKSAQSLFDFGQVAAGGMG